MVFCGHILVISGGPTLAQSLNPNLVAEQLSSTEIQPFYNDIKPKK